VAKVARLLRSSDKSGRKKVAKAARVAIVTEVAG